MTITITARVPLPKAVRKAARKPKISPATRSAINAYEQAYRAVYGVRPTVTADGNWLRIVGQAQGVTPARLRAMTTQLKLRAG